MNIGMDACFKLKLKNRKLKDRPINQNMSYYVNEQKYQAHVAANPDDADAQVWGR